MIAICYDFDGTLSRRSMQEDTIFQEYRIDSEQFWKGINQTAKDEGYDKVLCYLNRLIFDPRFQKEPLTETKLTNMARKIQYYPGVENFFPYINEFIQKESSKLNIKVNLEHYIISSGMKAILNGVAIKKYFKEIYACEYEYNKDGTPKCVKMAINDTTKTQFLFRINKGKLRLDQDINEHMDEEERRIPFFNMIYIGDGDSDIPCMTVACKNGGYALAVYPSEEKASEKCLQLFRNKRVNHIAPADFNSGSTLVQILETVLKTITQNMVLRRSMYDQKQVYADG
ncbi:MAG: hypothetical protein A3J12_08675 [Omnitrophica bacterium RIFCSPLOWO2_02_FULL_44_11]|nr:MAG: hypothetical protein A3J12_08675 [Omnitrophica bacterium RIFCSPLOWO2_02_FULL_44_11]